MQLRPTLTYEAEPSAGAYFRELKLRAGLAAAAQHRRRLGHVAFIGVTGSCGKTTTKELIAAVLGSELRGRKSPGGHNSLDVSAKTVLRTTARDEFCVLEVAAGRRPGMVERNARMIRPNVAVITTVGGDHHSTFRTLDATAAEKRALVSAVIDGGTAVLNADDPRVIAMRSAIAGDVISFGHSPQAQLRAENVESRWPERLSFTLHYAGRSLPVRTRLCGTHWITSVLAAIGVAVAMRVSLDGAVEALAAAEPTPRRMSPVFRDGATFIEDHEKSPFWTLDAAFAFMDEARAKRKVIVIGTISDIPGVTRTKYVSAARRALAVADEVIFAGPCAKYALKASTEARPNALHAFSNVSVASAYLHTHLREGDLVLLKGSADADGLGRMVSPPWGARNMMP